MGRGLPNNKKGNSPRNEVGKGPVWKDFIVQPRPRLHSFVVPYIFYSKFSNLGIFNL